MLLELRHSRMDGRIAKALTIRSIRERAYVMRYAFYVSIRTYAIIHRSKMHRAFFHMDSYLFNLIDANFSCLYSH